MIVSLTNTAQGVTKTFFVDAHEQNIVGPDPTRPIIWYLSCNKVPFRRCITDALTRSNFLSAKLIDVKLNNYAVFEMHSEYIWNWTFLTVLSMNFKLTLCTPKFWFFFLSNFDTLCCFHSKFWLFFPPVWSVCQTSLISDEGQHVVHPLLDQTCLQRSSGVFKFQHKQVKIYVKKKYQKLENLFLSW